jgi:eukaryotic-like serine/threonine-protein kinase
MKLVLIPPGEFHLGISDEEIDAMCELLKHRKKWTPKVVRDFALSLAPRHRVILTRPFYLGLHEVTVGQFRDFVEEAGYVTELEKQGGPTWRKPGHAQGNDHPVVRVSWRDAEPFTDWLGGREGETYRLPTDAEWEYACRAGTTTRFYFGDQAADLGNFEWWGKNSGGSPHPVGQKRPNPWGLYDMLGNVREWCADWYSKSYYQESPLTDPSGPSPSPGVGHVMRLGAWGDDIPPRLWCSTRDTGTKGNASRGYRIVREIE